MSDFMSEAVKKIAKGYTARLEMQIRIVLKPKPRLLTERMWLRLASRFIYIEKTQPSMKDENNA